MNRMILLLFIICISSCSDGLFHELNRLDADPQLSMPDVLSFLEEGIINVDWDEDQLADEYVLYRAPDSVVLNFIEIYRGTDNYFSDTTGIVGQIYHYSLAKVRGLKEFDTSSSVAGVCSQVIRDSLEDNDSSRKATLLSSDLTANLFGYQDLSGGRIFDEDWFFVNVPPRRTAYIVLEQLNPAPAGGTDTHFDFYLEGHPPVPVLNNSEMTITNDADIEMGFWFKVCPNAGKFFPGVGSGGTIVSYRISLIRIQ